MEMVKSEEAIVVQIEPRKNRGLYTKVAKPPDHRFRFGMTRRIFAGDTNALIASSKVPSSRRSSFSSRAFG